MTHIWTSRFHNRPGDPKFCRAAVYDRTPGQILAHDYQCQRKPVVCREVDGKEYGFCRQHDPVAVKARDEERSRQYRAEVAARNAARDRERQTKAAFEACKKACEAIAAGYDEPVAMAHGALLMFPE